MIALQDILSSPICEIGIGLACVPAHPERLIAKATAKQVAIIFFILAFMSWQIDMTTDVI